VSHRYLDGRDTLRGRTEIFLLLRLQTCVFLDSATRRLMLRQKALLVQQEKHLAAHGAKCAKELKVGSATYQANVYNKAGPGHLLLLSPFEHWAVGVLVEERASSRNSCRLLPWLSNRLLLPFSLLLFFFFWCRTDIWMVEIPCEDVQRFSYRCACELVFSWIQ